MNVRLLLASRSSSRLPPSALTCCRTRRVDRQKKELLFSDDFEGAEPAKVWHKVVPTFVVEKGALKGTQTRDQNVPAADGKPAITAHAAVHGLDIPTKDSVVEVRIRFEGASMIDVEFDDRKYMGPIMDTFAAPRSASTVSPSSTNATATCAMTSTR